MAPTSEKATIVLVHGAFAESSSWNGVIAELQKAGHTVIAAANPLRGVASDAACVSKVVSSISGPVVMVGHSYGGQVVSNVKSNGNVKALVYVSAFAPEAGESGAGLAAKFPGSTLEQALAPPIPLEGGDVDLSILQDKFHEQFAADLPEAESALMAATQRPVSGSALNDPSGEPSWKTIPSYFIYGDADKCLPPQGLGWMAARAASKKTVVVGGGSHVVMISNSTVVAKLIVEAAASV
ncbi:pimeloyl-ACP methyl ester carboxylesterase [Phyllobacterium sp. 1468]|uniref:alpha/beta hydrolase n=1 Tax=Phyllobacterium sp. 1468 TaxID=2817759 RepID=UPI0028667978|nr:alpha/beta hydrolase [Phyllobacterium sp. 1468]MDR6632610.1 pimeloyl-ACP methyl ester carboxylesterase [Phyllobacterium sp. 1468]